ncbi:hypothetical protein AB0J82_12630 [Asanoa sp. NPDC049518]|uniref:hypothetical protein n=1 Tax=unclassified Asanoa TaxID=2685164 RepID=UPI003434E96E
MSRSRGLEGLVLVLILITVGAAAGAASFTHVHDWTMDNSPEHTPGWFGWANAVISELVPIAALLTIRQRRRTGGPIGYPMFLLIAAAGLSLAAQLAVAKAGPSGWLLSAVPAIAFMALVKLVLAPVQTATEATTEAHPVDDTAPAPTAAPEATPAVSEVVEPVPTHLVGSARFAVVNHEQHTGRPITADELAARIAVTPDVAGQLLDQIRPTTLPARTINGTPVLDGVR